MPTEKGTRAGVENIEQGRSTYQHQLRLKMKKTCPSLSHAIMKVKHLRHQLIRIRYIRIQNTFSVIMATKSKEKILSLDTNFRTNELQHFSLQEAKVWIFSVQVTEDF